MSAKIIRRTLTVITILACSSLFFMNNILDSYYGYDKNDPDHHLFYEKIATSRNAWMLTVVILGLASLFWIITSSFRTKKLATLDLLAIFIILFVLGIIAFVKYILPSGPLL